ncbi:hypothetical protein SUGI_0232980 [Cryptomeria japonica]|nr:hypothetical protein SUGI_0232980 [Cryptomeria japonica]
MRPRPIFKGLQSAYYLSLVVLLVVSVISVFEAICTKKRNRLTQKRLNDLVYVRYNLRLHEKRVQGNNSYDALDIDEIDPYTTDWIVEPDGAIGDVDVDPFITDNHLAEPEREATEWAAKVAGREEAGDEFGDPEEADSSPVEDIATVAAATPSTSTPTQRQRSFLSFSCRRNL